MYVCMYVYTLRDDTFTAVHKDEIDDSHEHINEQNTDTHFTNLKENEKMVKYPDKTRATSL